MTCIVGLIDNGMVYIGGDSAGVSGSDLIVRNDKKVFKVGNFIFGFTSSFRMGQLLQYSFSPPKYYPDKPLMKYMVVDFIDSIRECFKKGGYASKSNEVESAGTFIVGYNGALFCIDSDYQVAMSVDKYYSCGCGSQIANGSMYSTSSMNPEDRILIALKAAENHSSGVRGPFTVVSC